MRSSRSRRKRGGSSRAGRQTDGELVGEKRREKIKAEGARRLTGDKRGCSSSFPVTAAACLSVTITLSTLLEDAVPRRWPCRSGAAVSSCPSLLDLTFNTALSTPRATETAEQEPEAGLLAVLVLALLVPCHPRGCSHVGTACPFLARAYERFHCLLCLFFVSYMFACVSLVDYASQRCLSDTHTLSSNLHVNVVSHRSYKSTLSLVSHGFPRMYSFFWYFHL